MGEDPHFRRTARRPIELSVSYRRDRDDARLEQTGRLIDLGLGGAQIRCGRPPSLSTALIITLTAPSAWDPLDLPATVRWVNGPEKTFGIAFEAISRAQASALYELLQVSRFAEAEA